MSEIDTDKVAKGMLFILRHMKDLEGSLMVVQAELRSLRESVRLNPELEKRFQEVHTSQVREIAPMLDAVASSYEAIILDMKSSQDLA